MGMMDMMGMMGVGVGKDKVRFIVPAKTCIIEAYLPYWEVGNPAAVTFLRRIRIGLLVLTEVEGRENRKRNV